ncbi:hypothetical protein [Cupriavidus taiwanensis]|uniref:hypothetical protein n=1 Tax=Cupriavidus taiwanensis TaxID=164546 RepID=UPI0012FEABFA|nr:hypothetical protein [Cupriavidus taiwanensis]
MFDDTGVGHRATPSPRTRESDACTQRFASTQRRMAFAKASQGHREGIAKASQGHREGIAKASKRCDRAKRRRQRSVAATLLKSQR